MSQFFRSFLLIWAFWGALGCGGGFDLLGIPTETVQGDQDLGSGAPEDSSSSVEAPESTSSRLPTGGRGGQTGWSNGQCSDRNYQIYVPASYSSTRAAPLIAAMHGAGDSFQNFAQGLAQAGWMTLAEREGFLLLIPDHTNGTRRSFLHFNQDFSLNIQATLSEGRSLLDCIYYGVGSRYNIETTQIYWMGFSEGASFTNFMANDLSLRLRAVAVYAGASGKFNRSIPRKIPLFYVSGTGDFNYQGIVQASAEWTDHPHRREFVSATHSFAQLNSRVSPESLWTWLNNVPAEPVVSGYNN